MTPASRCASRRGRRAVTADPPRRRRAAHARPLGRRADVKVDTPARIELGDDLKVTWTATDADGDALTSIVSISPDGGATWRSLGDATTGTSLTVKAIVSIAGPTCA